MRFATVVASSYETSPLLPRLARASELGRAMYDRLTLPDAAFTVEWLEGLLAELPAPPRSVLLYFSGYLLW